MLRTQQNDNDPLRLDTNTIRGMQLELRRAAGFRETEDEQADDRTRSGNALPGTGNLARPIDRPIDTAETPSLNQRPLDNSIGAISNPEGVRPGMRNRLNVPVPPARQSSQLARMERQLDQYYGQRLATAEQENQEFLRQLRARQAAADKLAQQGDPGNPEDPATASPGDTARPNYREMSRRILEQSRQNGTGVANVNANANANGTNTARQPSAIQESIRQVEQRPPREATPGAPGAGTAGGPGTGAAPRQGGDAPVVRPQPVQVASLAEGIKAGGLAKVMRQAESLMKEGKYVSALEQYVLAEEVAPNNPLVWLGQAHAELGAGYYLRAADHLRRALAAEPALMMAQYDLRGMIGQDRLETLVRDLKETAKAQEKEHGLVFLLSYLAYNTSNTQQAAVYLDLAQKRAGGNDDVYRLVRLHWNLPGGDGAIIEEPRIPLSEVYKQFEQGNVASATVTDTAITAQLKAPTELPGLSEPVRSFRATLPAGAAAGAFGTWLKNNSNGATVRFETTAPAATEANK
jgi:tetratricopeptide (TPR) repeat protein